MGRRLRQPQCPIAAIDASFDAFDRESARNPIAAGRK
jgi:hypothetical protein